MSGNELNAMNLFVANVDNWGAVEWFDRLANAIREQDKAVIAKNEMAFDTYRMIAASSAMRLVREFENDVRAALSPQPVTKPAMGQHPDQTSPMTVGPEEFFDQIEHLVESYIGGEYEAQGCAAEQILEDVRDRRIVLTKPAMGGVETTGAIPAGYVLVPIKPTKEMAYQAACYFYGKRRVERSGGISGIAMTVDSVDRDFWFAFKKIWRAAIANAPQPASPATTGGE